MSSRSGSKDGGPAEMLFASAFAFGLFVALAAVLVPAFPPLQDYWEWVYQGVLTNRMMIESAEASPFIFQPYPVPNSFIQGLVALLLEIVSPSVAAKMVLLLYVGLTLLVYRSLRLLGPEVVVAPAMMILFSILFGSLFLNGYVNNAFGNLILLYYFVKLLQREPSVFETFCFALILFFCHAVSFFAFAMIVVIHVLWREIRWENALALFPTGLMLLLYIARKDHTAADLGFDLSGVSGFLNYKAYMVAKLGPYHNFFYDGVGDFDRLRPALWAGIIANGLFALALLGICFQVFLRQNFLWTKHAAFVSVGIFLALYPFLPISIAGVANFGERFLTIAVLLLVPLAVSAKARTKLVIQTAGLISLVILPVLIVFGIQAVKYENTLVESRAPISIQSQERIRYLFSHTPFLGAGRAEDIRHVLNDGLKTAAPLTHPISLIRPRESLQSKRNQLDRTVSPPQ